MSVIFNAFGGLALFLLAMVMMTDGLKVFVGNELKSFLQKWTSSPFRGVLSGALLTAIVQSSSAVTVATIGFVNAGVLTLRQALGIIFGSNVGTTMTGWIISLVGFGLKIETLAMPILAVGVALRFVSSRKKFHALGEVLTGFGLFFLGLTVLKAAFSDIAASYGTSLLTSADASSAAVFILGGFIATLLTQSSSAALAIILMAASQSVMGINAAAAAIIGANIGTTSTAIFATINATPNAKRVAAGHMAFNLITGVIAIALLHVILSITIYTGQWIGVESNIVLFLALFHTVFNILGVLLFFPFIGRLSDFLGTLFKTHEEDISRPRYLDKTVTATPAMACSALWKELERMNEYSCLIIASVLGGKQITSKIIQRKSEAVFSLGQAITDFVTNLRMEKMSQETSEDLPNIIRTARYLEETARLAPEVASLVLELNNIKKADAKQFSNNFMLNVDEAIQLFSEQEKQPDHHDRSVIIMDKFQSSYQETKAAFLKAAASKKMSPEKADELLDKLSYTRRMIEQIAKADHMLTKWEETSQDQA